MNNKLMHIDAERDLTEILKLIEEYMKRTYIKELEREMIRCREKCEHTPTRELELLVALEPFIQGSKRKVCEDLIRFLKYEQVAKEMLPLFFPSHMRQEEVQEDQVKQILVKLLLYKVMDSVEKK